MDRLPVHLTARLDRSVLEKLQMVFDDLAEEAQANQAAMKAVAAQLVGDIRALEASREAREEERMKERAMLAAAAEAARLAECQKIRDSLSEMALQVKTITEQKEKERERCFALEKESKRTLFLLEQKEEEDYERMMAREKERIIRDATKWEHVNREKESMTVSMVLATAALKQRVLIELKDQAQKWMLAPERSTQDDMAVKAPVVFTTWMLREGWRKLQANKPTLNDDIQTFCNKKEIEKQVFENHKLEAEIAAEFAKKRKSLMADFQKKEEKIKAAELKQKIKIEKQMRKQLERAQKAEEKEKERREAKEKKEKERREAKEKKEAEKLAKKQAREERGENRRSRFFFWRRSARAN